MSIRSLIVNHMKKRIRYLLAIVSLTVFGLSQSSVVHAEVAEPNPLIISAVQITGGEGKTSEDFIELYNPNPTPVNLNGYRLVKRSATGTADSSIKSWSTDTFVPPYSFYLWANSSFTSISSVPDIVTSSTLADNNGVGLRLGGLDAGTLVDSLAWGITSNGFKESGLTNPVGGQSITRDTLLDINSTYSISKSSPRNSTVQLLPESSPDPIDDSVCSLNSSSISVEQGSGNSNVVVNFINTGNTIWGSPDYIIEAGVNDILLDTQIISPNSQLTLNQEIATPANVGDYNYSWQMSNSGIVFGQVCNLSLNVAVPVDDSEDGGDSSEEGLDAELPKTIRITELLVNPHGVDGGQESLELYNYGSEAVDVSGWKLDDISQGIELSEDNYVLPDMVIAAGSYKTIVIPAGKFVMNNTKGDSVSLLSKESEFIDTVVYSSNSPAGKTYSLAGSNAWQWSKASLGEANPVISEEDEDDSDNEDDNVEEEIVNVEVIGLQITELYPAPSAGEDEFLELYNNDTEIIELSNVILKIGNKSFVIDNYELEPGHYFILSGKDLPAHLVDAGTTVELLELAGDIISKVSYPKAIKGMSYAKINDGFAWTISVTPEDVNVFTKKPDDSKNKSEIKKSTVVPKMKSSSKVSLPKNSSTLKTSATNGLSKSSAVATMPQNKSDSDKNNSLQIAQESDKKAGNKAINIAAVAAASIGAGVFAIYRFGVV